MKKVSIGPKPVMAAPTPAVSPDQWVGGGVGGAGGEPEEPAPPAERTKRLTIDVPLSLHTRFKTRCAIRGVQMADVMRELLAKEFPPE